MYARLDDFILITQIIPTINQCFVENIFNCLNLFSWLCHLTLMKIIEPALKPPMITNVSPESKRRHGQINWTDFWWWSILLLLVLRVIDKSIRFYQLHLKRLLFDFAMLRVTQYFQYFGTKVSNQILILGMYFLSLVKTLPPNSSFT